MLTSAKSGNSRFNVFTTSFKFRVSSRASRNPNLNSMSWFQELGRPQDEGNFLGPMLPIEKESEIASEGDFE